MKNNILRTLIAGSMVFSLAAVATADEITEDFSTEVYEEVLVTEQTSGRKPVTVMEIQEELAAEVEAFYFEPVIEVNGEEIPFTAFSIEDFTYVSLLDLAYTLSGTASRFDFAWNLDVGGFVFDRSRNFFLDGHLYGYVAPENQLATLSTIPMAVQEEYIKPISLRSYIINDTSYVQLNQMSIELDFAMSWDQEDSKISITTKSFG